jgi:hypothetical protein
MNCLPSILVSLTLLLPLAVSVANTVKAADEVRPPSATKAKSSTPLVEVSLKSPKTVFVVVSRAEIYSGPSAETYPTGYLARGQALEAYHRTPDGWIGIRPPAGSFSWVMASDAYLLPGGRVIEITAKDAVSWIGSELGSAKQYRWQIKLQRGEQLAVIGESESTDKRGERLLWYKIAPPSGEFRWIDEKAVALDPPAEPGIARVMQSRAGGPSNVRAAAAHSNAATGERVRPAGYNQQVDVFGESVLEGVVVEDGYFFDDSHGDDGDVFYLDHPHSEHVVHGPPLESHGGWGGWHAMELTDDGFRIPFLERRFQQAQANRLSDPLNHDPFSLSMARPLAAAEPPSVRAQVRQDFGIDPQRRYTPWRDPRELRERWSRDRSLGATRSIDRSSKNALASQETEAPEELRPSTSELLSRLGSALSSVGAADPSAPASTEAGSGLHGWGSRIEPSRSSVGGNSSAVAELGRLQLALSEMVSRPQETWNFNGLSADVQRLIDTAPTPIERGQARLLLERMEEFATLARKSDPNRSLGVVPASGYGLGMVSTASYASGSHYSAGNYDATGWLVPVHASTAGQPTHALTDDQGQIIAYVSGLPGMNLELYVNQSVGVQGLRGYLPQLQASHIQAQRVVRIQK